MKLKRERRGDRGVNNWLWRDMYSVAEEEEEEGDDEDFLADFGLHHLTSKDDGPRQCHNHDDAYHTPLLETNDHCAVDDMIRNPMEESTSSRWRSHPSHNNHDNENIDEASGAFVLLRRLKVLPKMMDMPTFLIWTRSLPLCTITTTPREWAPSWGRASSKSHRCSSRCGSAWFYSPTLTGKD